LQKKYILRRQLFLPAFSNIQKKRKHKPHIVLLMEPAEPRLKDIAHRLGISVSTVSRALRDHPDINRKTKEAVAALARELDYEPNNIARSLLNRRSNTIGIIVPKIGYHLYSTAISGIEHVAIQAGYSIMICQSGESFAREVNNVHTLQASRVGGLIISVSGETATYDHFQKIQRRNTPLVFFNRDCELAATKVVIDNFGAAYEAVTHLAEIGCKRIAYLGGPQTVQISNKRLQGYQKSLEAHGMAVDERLITHCEFNKESALNAARKLLYLFHPPDGILAFSDQLAINVMLAAKERGLKIPQQLAVIGFNNEPVDELIEPTLTSIDQPSFQMGERAAHLLLEQINQIAHPPPVKTEVLNSKLIIRASTNRNKL
jgi:DNA-binding LacI/PurR family transcriptional regulator